MRLYGRRGRRGSAGGKGGRSLIQHCLLPVVNMDQIQTLCGTQMLNHITESGQLNN